MNSRERVCRAIKFDTPDRIPLWNLNKNEKQGDVLWYDFRISTDTNKDGDNSENTSEWGYTWKTLNDGTMGQPTEPVIKTWDDLKKYEFPKLNQDVRLKGLRSFLKDSEDYYRLPLLIITGFTTYTFLRGFENAMIDFIDEPENSSFLLDGIFAFEKELVTLAAKSNFDGFHFGDDWGTQDSLIISPKLWRQIFKPRYKDLFDHVHESGLHVWFHSCGNIEAIVPDLYEIGVDVLNIAQPNVVNLENIGSTYKGKQCFLIPISYQTVSISGTPKEILEEGRRIREFFSVDSGGLIGYVEEYSCMGMSNENFEACEKAFTL